MDPKFQYQPLANNLPLTEQTLLVRVIEECGELIQCATKTLRFGPSSVNPYLPPEQQETNIDAFIREQKDLLDVLKDLDWDYILQR